MPDPKEHLENRGVIETILRYLPGFRGYLEKEYRRESDALQRTWLADCLERSKRSLSDYTRDLAESGKIDQLPRCERMRNRLDRVIARLRGAMPGYSGFFDFVQVNEELLDDVYDHDVAMMENVESLAGSLDSLANTSSEPDKVMPELLQKIEAVDQQIDQREDLLKGLATEEPS